MPFACAVAPHALGSPPPSHSRYVPCAASSGRSVRTTSTAGDVGVPTEKKTKKKAEHGAKGGDKNATPVSRAQREGGENNWAGKKREGKRGRRIAREWQSRRGVGGWEHDRSPAVLQERDGQKAWRLENKETKQRGREQRVGTRQKAGGKGTGQAQEREKERGKQGIREGRKDANDVR